jgi:hypothetical protein
VEGEPLLPLENVSVCPTCAIGRADRHSRVAVVGPVPVTVRLFPWHETVKAVLGAIWTVCVPDIWVVEVSVSELWAAGRRAIEPASVSPGVTWGQVAGAVGPEVGAPIVATATWELPESLTVAPRAALLGA